MNTDNTNTTPATGFSLAALAQTAAQIAPSSANKKSRITRLGDIGDNVKALYIRLDNSKCKMGLRGRVHVALRAIPECPAAGAEWALATMVKWEDLPEGQRALAVDENGDKLPDPGENEIAVFATIRRKA